MEEYWLEPEWYRILFLHFAVLLSIRQSLIMTTDRLQITNQTDSGMMWLITVVLTVFLGLRPDTMILGDLYGLTYERTTELEMSKDWLF